MLVGLGLLYVVVATMLGILGGVRWIAIFVAAVPVLLLAPVALYTAHCGDCGHGVWVAPLLWLFVAFCIAGHRRQVERIDQPMLSQTPPGAGASVRGRLLC